MSLHLSLWEGLGIRPCYINLGWMYYIRMYQLIGPQSLIHRYLRYYLSNGSRLVRYINIIIIFVRDGTLWSLWSPISTGRTDILKTTTRLAFHMFFGQSLNVFNFLAESSY